MTDCPWLGDFVVAGMDSSGMGFCFFFASFYLFITFDGACKVCLSGIKILAKERAIFFTLAYPLCENRDVTLHHLNWAPMF